MVALLVLPVLFRRARPAPVSAYAAARAESEAVSVALLAADTQG